MLDGFGVDGNGYPAPRRVKAVGRGRRMTGWVLAGVAVVFAFVAVVFAFQAMEPCNGFDCMGRDVARDFALFGAAVAVMAGGTAFVLLRFPARPGRRRGASSPSREGPESVRSRGDSW